MFQMPSFRAKVAGAIKAGHIADGEEGLGGLREYWMERAFWEKLGLRAADIARMPAKKVKAYLLFLGEESKAEANAGKSYSTPSAGNVHRRVRTGYSDDGHMRGIVS